MPIFEYLCEDCGTKFEKLVRRPASDEVLCPSCGQSHLEQQLSTFAAPGNGHEDSWTPAMTRTGEGGGCAGGMCRTPDLCGRN
jgi:putative FmdB family regulatory protein